MGSSSTTSPVSSPCALLLLLVLLSCSQCHVAAHHHAQPRPSAPAIVVGSVHSGSEPPGSGTKLAVRCRDGNGRTVFLKQAVTDRHGKFRVHLAQEPIGRLRSVTSCSVQLQQRRTSTSASPCAAVTTNGGLRPVASKNKRHGGGGGARVFSAGEFVVRPELCGQKGLFFPPIPLVPEPPNIGGVPIPPNPITPAPPSLVPPVFPTPSPPSVLPPLLPQPPPSSIVPPLLPPLFSHPPPPPPPTLLPPLLPLPGCSALRRSPARHAVALLPTLAKGTAIVVEVDGSVGDEGDVDAAVQATKKSNKELARMLQVEWKKRHFCNSTMYILMMRCSDKGSSLT